MTISKHESGDMLCGSGGHESGSCTGVRPGESSLRCTTGPESVLMLDGASVENLEVGCCMARGLDSSRRAAHFKEHYDSHQHWNIPAISSTLSYAHV